MKKVIFLAFILSGFVFGGCATHTAVKEQIQRKSIAQGSVFEELRDGQVRAGYVVLTIRASMKTPKEGYYLFESKDSLHGKPQYPFIFNIGGQGAVWMANGKPDLQQKIVDGRKNPEGGEGVKYDLERKITLEPGSYKIYLGLTGEAFEKEITVNLTDQPQNVLEFLPVYRRDRIRGKSFYKGISNFEVFLNGKRIDRPENCN